MVYKSKLYREYTETVVTINVPNSKRSILEVVHSIDPLNKLIDFINKAIIKNRQDLIINLLRDREDLRDVVSDIFLSSYIKYQRLNRGPVNITNNLVVNDKNFRLTYIPKDENIGITYELVETASNNIIGIIILDNDINLRMIAMKKLIGLLIENYPKSKKFKTIYEKYNVDREIDYPTNKTIDKDLSKLFNLENRLRRDDNIQMISNVVYYLNKRDSFNNFKELREHVKFNHGTRVVKDPVYRFDGDKIYYTIYDIVDNELVTKDINITFSDVSFVERNIEDYRSLKYIIKYGDVDKIIRELIKYKKFNNLEEFLSNDPYKWKRMSLILIGTELRKALGRDAKPEDIETLTRIVSNDNIVIDREMLESNIKDFNFMSPEVSTKLDKNILYVSFMSYYGDPKILKNNLYFILNKALPNNKEYWVKAFKFTKKFTDIVRPMDIDDCYLEIREDFRKENLDLSIVEFTSLIRLLSIDHFDLGTDLSKFDNLYEYSLDVYHLISKNPNEREYQVIRKLKHHRS